MPSNDSHSIQQRQRMINGRLQPPSRRLKLQSDVFSLATHPTERLVAVGESSGRVGVWSWPEEEDDEDEEEDSEDDSENDNESGSEDSEDSEDSGKIGDEVRGKSKKVKIGNKAEIKGRDEKEEKDDDDENWWEKKWSVKRHKGSTRCVRFSCDGEGMCYTATSISIYFFMFITLIFTL